MYVMQRMMATAACSFFTTFAAAQSAAPVYQGTFASGNLMATFESAIGDDVRGQMLVRGTPAPLRGEVKSGRVTGTFEFNGKTFPFEAGFEGDVLVVTSGGVMHRLVKQVVEDNPLADAALSKENPLAVAGEVGGAVQAHGEDFGLEEKYPKAMQLDGGLSIRYPSTWTQQELGAFKALVPASEPNQIFPKAIYAVQTAPWELGDLSAAELGERLVPVVAQFFPGVAQEGAVETLGTSMRDGVRLKFGGGQAIAGLDGKLHLLAKVQDGTVLLLMGLGDESAMKAHDETVREMLRTFKSGKSVGIGQIAGAAERTPDDGIGPIDPELVGTWRSTETLNSPSFDGGGATMVTETVLELKADGTYSMGSRSAGGGSGMTFDAPLTISSRGQWSASDSILRSRDDSGSSEVKYLWHEGQLVFKLDNGKYMFWSK